MKTLVLTALGLLGLATAVCWGADPPPKDKDPQAGYEPRSEPGEGQKLLERFVGIWDVQKTFYPRSGDPVETKGVCRQTMIHGGRFLQSDFVFHQDANDVTGLGVIGFEPATGKFTSFWTDSRSTRMSIRESEDKFNGEEIVLYSRSLDPEAKDARRSRTTTRLEGNGDKIVHRQFAVTPDGKERLVMELVLTRKNDAPKPGN
ncbi:MAG TPA: DUF1579 family protein [Gemmataceae bacterium]|nr:DUF1579 family protein [Gemmataceae bacterium]